MADKDRSGIEIGILNDDLDDPIETRQADLAAGEMRRKARRRVLTGGVIGAPFILTLTSRPALANYCSPSAMASGNLSRAGDVVCSGLDPEWWLSHPVEVANCGIIVGPCNPIYYDGVTCTDYSVPTAEELNNYRSSYNSLLSPDEKQAINYYKDALLPLWPGSPPFGTPFSEIFGSGLLQDVYMTIMQSLDVSGGSPELAAQSSAAYLNAIRFGEEEFGLSPSGVVDFVQAGWPSSETLDTLTAMNSRS